MATKGILGTKLGMTQVFDSDNRVIPVTVVQAGPCTVTQVKTAERDGYTAVQLAYGTRKRVSRPAAGHLGKSGVGSARVLAELRLDDGSDLPEVGARVTCQMFSRGDVVDATGVSKGKGYAGVMKRHNFHGIGDGHGVKKKNRHPGAIGACATPGRTFRGQRMAGRLGGDRVTVQNLVVVDVDPQHQLILVRGALPGSNGEVVFLRNAVKRPVAEFSWTQPEPSDASGDAELAAAAEGSDA